jgi:hypothetical protein
MSAAGIVVAEAGTFLLASEAVAAYVVLRVSDRAKQAVSEAVKAAERAVEFNWVKGGVKIEVTAPEGRYPKLPAKLPDPAAKSGGGQQPRTANGRFASSKPEPLRGVDAA